VSVGIQHQHTQEQMVQLARRWEAQRLRELLSGPGVCVNAMMPKPPGHTALHLVCTEAVQRKAEKATDLAARTAAVLIEFGAAVNPRNAEGATPLMIAVQSQNQPLIDVLLGAGALPELSSPRIGNAFHVAATEGSPTVLRSLLEAVGAGLSMNAIDVSGVTPLEVAACLGNTDAVALLHDYLLKHPGAAQPRPSSDSDGDRPLGNVGLNDVSRALWFAVANARTDVVRFLARQGGQIEGDTPLSSASDEDAAALRSVIHYVAAFGTDDSAESVQALFMEAPVAVMKAVEAGGATIRETLRKRDCQKLERVIADISQAVIDRRTFAPINIGRRSAWQPTAG